MSLGNKNNQLTESHKAPPKSSRLQLASKIILEFSPEIVGKSHMGPDRTSMKGSVIHAPQIRNGFKTASDQSFMSMEAERKIWNDTFTVCTRKHLAWEILHEFSKTEVTCLRPHHSFTSELGLEFRSLDPRLGCFYLLTYYKVGPRSLWNQHIWVRMLVSSPFFTNLFLKSLFIYLFKFIKVIYTTDLKKKKDYLSLSCGKIKVSQRQPLLIASCIFL